MTETMLLAVVGGGLGVLLAYVSIGAVRKLPLLLGVALAAAFVPALRALRVHPILALRAE
jgi:hypothetical protein